jgi:hypothetical protein
MVEMRRARYWLDWFESSAFVAVRLSARPANGETSQQTTYPHTVPKADRADAALLVTLLRRMLRGRGKALYPIVDGRPAHKSKAVREYVDGLKRKSALHFLPGYTPARLHTYWF